MRGNPTFRLTVDEAIGLLVDGDQHHSFANPNGGMFIGADLDRAAAITEIREAFALELGGPSCQAMGHGLVVWTSRTRRLFFQADRKRVAAMEAAKAGDT